MQSFEMKTEIQQLLSWFRENARSLPWREKRTPYRIWVSEIMLQQTRVEAVKGYFERFMTALPEAKDLAAVSEDELLKLWEGLGYYNRVRNMQKAARIVCEQYEGELPSDYEELLKLPGIGTYTAGAIASQAFGIPVPAVDGNVLRVLARIDGDESDIADPAVKKRIEERLSSVMQTHFPLKLTVDLNQADILNQTSKHNRIDDLNWADDLNRAGDFNQALMELGATVCVPNGAPKCDVCPMQYRCRAYAENRQDFLPVKSPKKPRTIEEKTVFIIVNDRQVLIRKRAQKGLLAGMYEFPNTEGYLTEREVLHYVEGLGFTGLRIEELPDTRHIFTHREWHMKSYRVSVADTFEVGGLPQEMLLVNRMQIEETYALPSAFSRFTKYVKM